MSKEKSNSRADIFREQGNKLYKQNNHYEALIYYNKSLSYAENGSVQKSLAFANRSAIYLFALEYDKCLENIQQARENGYPKDKEQTLIDREQRCNWLKSQTQLPVHSPEEFFKLSFPPNEKIPFIANCMELREDNKYGRYIITNRNLTPGQVIAIEEAPVKSIFENGRYNRCYNCFKSNQMNLIPCEMCAMEMYCSQECYESYKNKKMCANDNPPEAYRLVLESLDACDGDMQKLRDLMEDPQLGNKTIFDFDFSDPNDPCNKYKSLVAINSLKLNNASKDLEDFIRKCPISKLWASPEDQAIAKKFLARLIDLKSNALGFIWWREENDGSLGGLPYGKREKFGLGLFQFGSLLSHSCDPNVNHINIDNKMVTVVQKPIKAGQQVCLTYGPTFTTLSRDERQKWLKEHFDFDCTCDACSNYYSMSLKRTDKNFKFTDEFCKSTEGAKQEFKRNCEYIRKNINSYPNFEIAKLIERNCFLLGHIGNVEPQIFNI